MPTCENAEFHCPETLGTLLDFPRKIHDTETLLIESGGAFLMAQTLHHITTFLERFAPLELAASWDNVGLLLGDDAASVSRIMTCLTLTSDVAQEAIENRVDLIVSHHPVLFKPVQRLVKSSSPGNVLLPLLQAGVAVYSPHTAFDSARLGINQMLAERMELKDVQPLRKLSQIDDPQVGEGRRGTLERPQPLSQVLERVKTCLGPERIPLQYTGSPEKMVTHVAIACGSAGEFLGDAISANCDLFLTGETRFHTMLEARERGIALILAGHYATERHGVEKLSDILQEEFPDLTCWASESESDPIQWSVD